MENHTTPVPSRFLALPAELRVMIYQYVGCSDVVPLHSGIFFEDHLRHPSLLRISRFIREDARPSVLQQQRLCPALSLATGLGVRTALLRSILRLLQVGSRPRSLIYQALLSSFKPLNSAIARLAPFYHQRKKEFAPIIELRVLLTEGQTKEDSARLDDLLRDLEQLDDKPHFVFVVGRKMEQEWRTCLEKKEYIKEFKWSVQVLARSPLIGFD
jgi:hypothetical protein